MFILNTNGQLNSLLSYISYYAFSISIERRNPLKSTITFNFVGLPFVLYTSGRDWLKTKSNIKSKTSSQKYCTIFSYTWERTTWSNLLNHINIFMGVCYQGWVLLFWETLYCISSLNVVHFDFILWLICVKCI